MSLSEFTMIFPLVKLYLCRLCPFHLCYVTVSRFQIFEQEEVFSAC